MGPRSAFPYVNGRLACEDIDLATLAALVSTPFYCYSRRAIERQFEEFRAAFAGMAPMICYAVKANSNQAVLRALAAKGAGMDVVSAGELRRALAAGAPAQRITFSGVGKTEAEIVEALEAGILCFNVESEPELSLISELAASRGRIAPVALRVNPDIDAKTHAKIATGTAANKFGVPLARALDVYREAALMPGVKACGVDVHIGSQITDLQPFDAAFALVASLVRELRAQGHAIEHADLGGGLGVPYREGEDPASYHPERYAALVKDRLGDLDLALIFEPGRLIVANAGVLVTRVLYAKRGEEKNFLIVDAAMNDLIRPTLYDAHHEIAPLMEPRRGGPEDRYDVVGPVCETGDYLGLDRRLPKAEAGDLLAVLSAGAYGAVQASAYNSRRLAPEVLVDGARWALVRPRPSYEDLIGLDRTPDWLG